MNLIDIIIMFVIIITGILGFKRGIFKELVIFVGAILIFVIAYKLKNYIGDFLVLNCPFLDFPNFLRGATALNIIVYQSLAFVLTAVVLFAIYDFILALSGVFEKILRMTIILGIPSKILGFIIGLIEGYVIAYVFVFFVSQPALNLEIASDSKYSSLMLNNTPILTNVTKDTISLADKITALSKITNVNEMNLSLIDLILENKVTSVPVVEKLVDKGKLNVKSIDTIINKYK